MYRTPEEKKRRIRVIVGGVILAAVAIGLIGFCTSRTPSANATEPYRAPTVSMIGYADATAGQTFATTSYADLAAATVSVPASQRVAYNNSGISGPSTRLPYIRVTWSAATSKATGTDGTCAIFVNGAIVAGTARQSTFAAGASSIGGFYEVARSSDAAQTVKLQCKSADTSVFTVAFGNIRVEEVVR